MLVIICRSGPQVSRPEEKSRRVPGGTTGTYFTGNPLQRQGAKQENLGQCIETMRVKETRTIMTPKSIQFDRASGILHLVWPDQMLAALGAWDLRCDCRCAACVDENTGIRILDPAQVSKDIRVTKVEMAGNYALRLTFSDAHANGLFTWPHLHGLALRLAAGNTTS